MPFGSQTEQERFNGCATAWEALKKATDKPDNPYLKRIEDYNVGHVFVEGWIAAMRYCAEHGIPDYYTKDQPCPTVQNILMDPSAHRWLKDTLGAALELDVVDVLNDLDVLTKVMQKRYREMVNV